MSDKMEVTQEVRFAVVIYGGTSLAIYINGVVQELLRLVRSTAINENGGLRFETPTETEAVYRKLGRTLGDLDRNPESPYVDPAPCASVRTRFVIDLISGTSAGGINGVFLAKALVNGQSLEPLKDLWYEEGDISVLLNDNGSRDARVRPQARPTSVLNSARMYDRLFGALAEMEKPGLAAVPLVEELDLFVTATDIDGLSLPIPLYDGVIQERRHRAVFRFNFGELVPVTTEKRNDFTSNHDPMLAFAARCTSSFPVAFEPMRLSDIDEILRRRGISDEKLFSASSTFQKFFTDYVGRGGVETPYATRAFGDGGYLDNKPFSYAIDQLRRRRARVPVDRKLLYLEPRPDLTGYVMTGVRPDVLENALAALINLPRYETIREDLQRVVHRNAEIAHRRAVVREIESLDFQSVVPDQVATPREAGNRFIQAEGAEWARQTTEDIDRELGSSYVAYQRLKVSSVVDAFLEQVRVAVGIEKHSALYRASRALFDVWQKTEYGKQDPSRTDAQFLLDFDMPYRLRRLEFVMSRADQLLRLRREQTGPAPTQHVEGKWLKLAASGITDLELYRKAVRELRRELAERHRGLLETQAAATASIVGLPSDGVLWKILGVTDGDPGRKGVVLAEFELSLEHIRDRAESIYQNADVRGPVQATAKAVAERYSKAFIDLSANLRVLFHLLDDEPQAAKARRDLAGEYSRFEAYDAVLFPITYNTDVGEGDEIDVVRISPIDATARGPKVNDLREKLRGTTVWSFGAFLDRRWRESDLLWGRLDGAERLITALLPGEYNRTYRDKLIDEAHTAILKAELPTLLDATVAHDLAPFERHKEYLRTVPKSVPAETAVRTAGRSARIVGEMLDTLADTRNVLKSQSTFVLRATRIVWGIAEVAIPRSFAELTFRYFFWLLLAVQLVSLLAVVVVPEFRSIVPVLARTLSLTAAALFFWFTVREFVAGHRKVWVSLVAILGIGVIGFAIVGIGVAVEDFANIRGQVVKGVATLKRLEPATWKRTWLAAPLLIAAVSFWRMISRAKYLRAAGAPFRCFETEDLAHVRTGRELVALVGHETHVNRWLVATIVESDFAFLIANGLLLGWFAAYRLDWPHNWVLGALTLTQVLADLVENVGLLQRNRSEPAPAHVFGGWLRIVSGLKFLLTGGASAALGIGVVASGAFSAWRISAPAAAALLVVAGVAFAVLTLAVWRSRESRKLAVKIACVAYGIGVLALVALVILEQL